MADYSGYTFEQIKAAIEAGQPGSFDTAATAFKSVLTALKKLTTVLPDETAKVTQGADAAWQGPASVAFVDVVEGYVAVINETITPLTPYESAMTSAGQALTTAQTEIATYAGKVAGLRSAATVLNIPVDEEAINAGARAILERLASAYITSGQQLTPLPDSGGTVTDSTAVAPTVESPDPLSLNNNLDPQLTLTNPPPTDLVQQPPPQSTLTSVTLGGPNGGNIMGVPNFRLSGGDYDPTTYLASYNGPPSGSGLVISGPGPNLVTSDPSLLTSATGGSGGFGVPATQTHLTTTNRTPGVGAHGGSAGGTGSRGIPPSMLGGGGMMGMGVGNRSGRANKIPTSIVGKPEDEETEERPTGYTGDQEWDDNRGVGTLGRPPRKEE